MRLLEGRLFRKLMINRTFNTAKFSCKPSCHTLTRILIGKFLATIKTLFNGVKHCFWIRMAFNMLGICKNNKVLNSIVKFVAIDVMNALACFKFSTKMLFHNITMFSDSLSLNAYNSISICYTPTLIRIMGLPIMSLNFMFIDRESKHCTAMPTTKSYMRRSKFLFTEFAFPNHILYHITRGVMC